MSSQTIISQFISLLENDRFWERVIYRIWVARGYVGDSYREVYPFSEAHSGLGAKARIEYDLNTVFGEYFEPWCQEVDTQLIFQELLFDNFDLAPITKSEFMVLVRHHLSGIETELEISFSRARLVANIEQLLFANRNGWYRIHPEEICLIQGNLFPSDIIGKEIWKSEYYGFWLEASATNRDPNLGVSARLCGPYTENAFVKVYEAIVPILNSLITTIRICYPGVNDIVGDFFNGEGLEFKWAGVSHDIQNSRNPILTRGLELAFLPADKRCANLLGIQDNELIERLRNATQLLVQADMQTNSAISLSLCFTAIESLICKSRGGGTSDELARNVAALLEPIAIERPSFIKTVRCLYSIRCDAMHGKSIENCKESLQQVRKLAANTYKACFDWSDHMNRIGEAPTRKGFIEELTVCATTGQRMVGVIQDDNSKDV
ncbi:MAG: hypothetical protein KDB03_17645 [Planctomycetales bacterium]|nr:hypothetical protein [Planctomycetales bacterium]